MLSLLDLLIAIHSGGNQDRINAEAMLKKFFAETPVDCINQLLNIALSHETSTNEPITASCYYYKALYS